MSIRKRINSFRYAFRGLADLLKTQPNARLHLLATLLVFGAGLYYQLNHTEWALIVVCIALVWGMEAMNTALEYLTDLVSPGIHPLAGKAKDAAAAAVLLSAISAVIIALLIFLPKIWP